MFGIIKTMFVVLLFTGLGNGSNHTKCVLLTNQKCMTQPTLINLHRNDAVKNFTAIHLQLNWTKILEVVKQKI